jgi:hypothetical protein
MGIFTMSIRQFIRPVAIVLSILHTIGDAQPLSSTNTSSGFVLECNEFQLRFDSVGRIDELRYLPTNNIIPLYRYWSNIANTGPGDIWDFPESITVSLHSPNVKLITFHYNIGKRSTIKVTQHQNFLEFELVDVIGNCNEIRMFGIVFRGLREFNELNIPQVTQIAPGLFGGMIAGNLQTRIFTSRTVTDSLEGIYAHSPLTLPSPSPYMRGQKFAFYICREQDLIERLTEIENLFNLPFGVEMKRNPANNVDYLFLLERNGSSAIDIIALCRETGLGNVLIAFDIWCDWHNPTAPFLIKPEIEQFVSDLRSAGLIVGAHAFVHKTSPIGYYATNFPNQVSSTIKEGFRGYNFTTSLPERAAKDFAQAIKNLGVQWVYLDASENLVWDEAGNYDNLLTWYLQPRISTAVLKAFREEGVSPVIHQESNYSYYYSTRIGQVDYWDGWPFPFVTPQWLFNLAARNAANRRRALLTPDLGWFGRKIHVLVSPNPFIYYDRDATWIEWQQMCETSWRYNIPMGIRTSYYDFISDSLKNRIVPLLRETVKKRRYAIGITETDSHSTLTSVILFQNYPNPFNLITKIKFSIPKSDIVKIRVYDILGKEIQTLLNEYKTTGSYKVEFDASNLPSGVYFYRMISGSYSETKKMILLR